MATIRLLNGKPLMIGNKVAMSDDCCCDQEPTGACCVDNECSIETEADCEDLGGEYLGDDTDCDPDPCEGGGCPVGFVTRITVEGELTGLLEPGTECGFEAFSLSAHAGPKTCMVCVDGCTTDDVAITYGPCESPCPTPERIWFVAVSVQFSAGNYFLKIDVPTFGAAETFCDDTTIWGGDDMVLENIGPDPTGIYTYSFNDPSAPSIHYDFTVTILL